MRGEGGGFAVTEVTGREEKGGRCSDVLGNWISLIRLKKALFVFHFSSWQRIICAKKHQNKTTMPVTGRCAINKYSKSDKA